MKPWSLIHCLCFSIRSPHWSSPLFTMLKNSMSLENRDWFSLKLLLTIHREFSSCQDMHNRPYIWISSAQLLKTALEFQQFLRPLLILLTVNFPFDFNLLFISWWEDWIEMWLLNNVNNLLLLWKINKFRNWIFFSLFRFFVKSRKNCSYHLQLTYFKMKTDVKFCSSFSTIYNLLFN